MRAAVSELLTSLWLSCDDCASPNNIVSVQLICSTSGKLEYLTAGLVYSSSDGRITASTIVNRLFAWLVSEDNPSILIDGTPVGLNQQCTTQLNQVTQSGCIQLFTSPETSEVTVVPTETTCIHSGSESPVQASSATHVAGFFAAGLATGVLITLFAIVLIFR